MKRGSKVFVRVEGCPEFGPIAWTEARSMLSDKFLFPSDQIKIVGENEWKPLSLDADVCEVKPPDDFRRSWLESRDPIGPRSVRYLIALKCPIPIERLNRKTAANWIGRMESVHPELANDVESWASKQESFGETPTALPTDPTSRQIEYLRSVGVELPSGATRKDASRLISGEATSGQIRRLKFYGIFRDGLSKDEASDLIESHKAAHPESEAAYQSVRGELIGSESFLEPNRSFSRPRQKVPSQRPRDGSPSNSNFGWLFFLLFLVALAIIKILASYRK